MLFVVQIWIGCTLIFSNNEETSVRHQRSETFLYRILNTMPNIVAWQGKILTCPAGLGFRSPVVPMAVMKVDMGTLPCLLPNFCEINCLLMMKEAPHGTQPCLLPCLRSRYVQKHSNDLEGRVSVSALFFWQHKPCLQKGHKTQICLDFVTAKKTRLSFIYIIGKIMLRFWSPLSPCRTHKTWSLQENNQR